MASDINVSASAGVVLEMLVSACSSVLVDHLCAECVIVVHWCVGVCS